MIVSTAMGGASRHSQLLTEAIFGRKRRPVLKLEEYEDKIDALEAKKILSKKKKLIVLMK